MGLFHFDASDQWNADDVHKVAGLCVHDESVAILGEQREVGMRDVEILLLGNVDTEWSKRRRMQEFSNLVGGHASRSQKSRAEK